MSNPKSIYIHIPFCKTKCPYCDFASFADSDYSANLSKKLRPKYLEYVELLNSEIDFRLNDSNFSQSLKGEDQFSRGPFEKSKVETIYFGGGTPSILSAEEFALIFDKLREHFLFDKSTEITLEANPGTVCRDKLSSFRDLGINRISLGVQSFDPELLEKLGRGHSLEDSYQAIEDIKSLDFNSWSLDLIYGLPRQNMESWEASVQEALKLEPPHISIYALSIEEGTPYHAFYASPENESLGNKFADLPQEESVVEMYHLANHSLEEAGLTRYEISNWAEPSHESRHNLTYWLCEEYYAFGLGAHGYLNSQRYANTKNYQDYLKYAKKGLFEEISSREMIDSNENLREQIMLKLRLKTGLFLDENIKNLLDLDKLRFFIDEGFIREFGSVISLSDEGLMVSNKLIAGIIKS